MRKKDFVFSFVEKESTLKTLLKKKSGHLNVNRPTLHLTVKVKYFNIFLKFCSKNFLSGVEKFIKEKNKNGFQTEREVRGGVWV